MNHLKIYLDLNFRKMICKFFLIKNVLICYLLKFPLSVWRIGRFTNHLHHCLFSPPWSRWTIWLKVFFLPLSLRCSHPCLFAPYPLFFFYFFRIPWDGYFYKFGLFISLHMSQPFPYSFFNLRANCFHSSCVANLLICQ